MSLSDVWIDASGNVMRGSNQQSSRNVVSQTTWDPESGPGYRLSEYSMPANNDSQSSWIKRLWNKIVFVSRQPACFFPRESVLPPEDNRWFWFPPIFGVSPYMWMNIFITLLFGVLCVTLHIRGFFIGLIFGLYIISLTLHEFAHAVVAYFGGDESVAKKGYLTLDVFRYTSVFGLVLPLILIVYGNIILPGGYIIVNMSNIRTKWWKTCVAVAGPAMNFLCALLSSIFVHIIYHFDVGDGVDYFAKAICCFAFFQIMATILNLLPLPTLDGWNAISPHLKQDCFIVKWLEDPITVQFAELLRMIILYSVLIWVPGVTYAFISITSFFCGLPADMIIKSLAILSMSSTAQPMMDIGTTEI